MLLINTNYFIINIVKILQSDRPFLGFVNIIVTESFGYFGHTVFDVKVVRHLDWLESVGRVGVHYILIDLHDFHQERLVHATVVLLYRVAPPLQEVLGPGEGLQESEVSLVNTG